VTVGIIFFFLPLLLSSFSPPPPPPSRNMEWQDRFRFLVSRYPRAGSHDWKYFLAVKRIFPFVKRKRSF